MVYFSNHSESESLEKQCSDCLLPNDAPCPILLVQMTQNYEQCKNDKLREAMNTLIDEDGICQMKPLLEKYKDSNHWKDPNQQDLF